MEKKMNQVSTFSERFKEAFGDRSVTDFAQELGLSKQSISAYLNGTRNPIRTTTEAIAKKLNVSPAWLCGLDVPMQPAAFGSEKSDNKKALAAHVSDEKDLILLELIQKLTPEQKDMLIAQIEVLISYR